MDPFNINKAADTLATGAEKIAAGAETVLTANMQQLQVFMADQMAQFRQVILQTVGEALAAATSERTEAIDQLDAKVHGWLDRCANFGVLPRAQ